MIILLGANGYIGRAFARALDERGWAFIPMTRSKIDYVCFDVLLEFLKRNPTEFLINAAGYTGVPNVDACEHARADTLAGNSLFPQTVAHACAVARVPWGHVSSGCIYSGAKLALRGQVRAHKDLMQPEIQSLLEANSGAIQGYSESDPPNFCFRDPPCSFYSGAKALAEEALSNSRQCYVWRLRIPFDESDNHRNYLSKIQRYAKVYNNVNSLSHRGDFVRACLDLWERRSPYGIYNVTNPGFVTTRQVVDRIQQVLSPPRSFEFWSGDEEFYRLGAATPRSNCVLDVSKLLATGVHLRSVHEALEDALRKWDSSRTN